LEIRSLWVKKWAADYVREELGIPGCRALIRIDKEVRREGERLSFETRYFVSSLDPDEVPPSTFQALIRGHWEIENHLHLPKDRYFEEDKHVLQGNGWGEAWTVLTNMALSISRLLRNGERTLKEVWERCHANPVPTAKRLGFNP
jgi:predicted transposase YbfD/YdcC